MIKKIEPTHANEVMNAVNNLVGAQPTKTMRKHLRQMMDASFLEEGGMPDIDSVYATFNELSLFLKKIGAMATPCNPEPQPPIKQPVSAN